jgi:hypothetical protein
MFKKIQYILTVSTFGCFPRRLVYIGRRFGTLCHRSILKGLKFKIKNSVHIFVEKIYTMGCLEGSGVPVLYIGRTVPKG